MRESSGSRRSALRVGRMVLMAWALGVAGCATMEKTTALPPGQPVRGAAAAYELMPAPGWARAEPRSGSDLTLVDSAGQLAVMVWFYPGGDADLDKLVAWRRSAILKRGASEYRERRFFLENSDLVPAALARYGFSGGPIGAGSVIEVLSVVTDRGAIEVIAAGRAENESQLTAVLTSLRILE